ncbi:MAG: transcription termination factor Rho [Clostridium sp.]|jgi:transcription termination factor Rho|nr:transcription termination factor Rho [Clostridium sp.]
MREKYESLPLVELRELAKVRKIRGVSIMRKPQLVQAMLDEDERERKAKEAGIENNQNSRKKLKMNPIEKSSAEKNEPAETVVRKKVMLRTKGDLIAIAPTRPQRVQYESEKSTDDEAMRQAKQTEDSAVKTPTQVNSEQPLDRPVRRSNNEVYDEAQYPKELDSGEEALGILEVMPDGYGFIRCANYLPGENDVYVAPSQIRKFGLKTGDFLRGNKRTKTQQEKFSALLFIRTINGYTIEEASKRMAFEDMTPIFPNERVKLETPGCSIAMRVMDLLNPVGKGQRGMIVSPPKAGKTTLIKDVARSILRSNAKMNMIILLIDERPEEVTDIKEAIVGENVEVIYSTFDELPEHHKRVSEMVMERAKRLVEHKKDVVILLDSITRLTRAYNQVVPPSGRTLSGGLDPSALHMPKRFFGAARNMREGGSLTILATALVDTGSKMDDVVYEEFKGTGNMEMVLDRKLSERRIFPAIDIQKSGTRREDLLLSQDELDAINIMRRSLNSVKSEEASDRILDMFAKTRTNMEFVNLVKKNRIII